MNTVKLSTKRILLCALGLVFASTLTAGIYQRTADGRTLVWNKYPTPDDQVAWSGQTDSHSYASGAGTLTWYKGTTFVSRYSGTMVAGKFNGVVTNEDANGNAFRGSYVNGEKRTWAQISGSTARTNGGYQKTADARGAIVWNNYPKRADQAQWSGDVDPDGYATGPGQLNWFKNGQPQTSYVGTMVKGKWQGVVINQDLDGKKFEGVWVDGVKTSDWGQVADFRRAAEPSPEQKELNAHWSRYLKEIQDDGDYDNWTDRPYDAYAKVE